MDADYSLRAQIYDLFQDLERAEKTLDSRFLESNLRSVAKERFVGWIETQRRVLLELLGQVEKDFPAGPLWARLAGCKAECTALFRECLAFLGGALMRGSELDTNMCQIVDALLLELSRRTAIAWDRFTILAEGEFYNDLADIIRISYPQFNIWHLPIAAHEFGHFAAPRITDIKGRFPFQDYLAEWKDGERTRHVKELFSDLFAVYTLGPAYACACIILRFNPRDAVVNRDGASHPSHIKRVYFMLQGLEDRKEHRLILQYLRDLWQKSLADVNLDAEPPAADRIQLKKDFDRQFSFLKNLPQGQYTGWLAADKLAAGLKLGQVGVNEIKGDSPLVDLVNAAWMARLLSKDEQAVKEINGRALDLCHGIIASGPQ
jgi:hypothetical protein